MIVEGIVTTERADGSVHMAPMGPRLDDDRMKEIILRPYATSRTLAHLKTSGEGVFHIVDDAVLIAEATLGLAEPAFEPSNIVRSPRLKDCCRFFEFKVESIDESESRALVRCKVLYAGRVNDFQGFNRAKHAVVESAILASRVGILPPEELMEHRDFLRSMVEKTGGAGEYSAFEMLWNYIEREGSQATSGSGSE